MIPYPDMEPPDLYDPPPEIPDGGRLVKARKPHRCSACGKEIVKGERYILAKYRSPRRDERDRQIGIEYITHRRHDWPCWWPEY